MYMILTGYKNMKQSILAQAGFCKNIERRGKSITTAHMNNICKISLNAISFIVSTEN